MNGKIKGILILVLCVLPVFLYYLITNIKPTIVKHKSKPTNTLMSLDDKFIEKVPVNDVLKSVIEDRSITQEDRLFLFALFVVSNFKKTLIKELDFSQLYPIYGSKLYLKYRIFYENVQDDNSVMLECVKSHKAKLISLLHKLSQNFGNGQDTLFLRSEIELIFNTLKDYVITLNLRHLYNFIQSNKDKIVKEFNMSKQNRNEELNNLLLTKKNYGLFSSEFEYTYIEAVMLILTESVILDVVDEVYENFIKER